MANLIREKPVIKTRKNHLCHGCREIIPKGSRAFSLTNVDGDIYTLYFCTPCYEFLKQYPEYCADPYDDVYEGAVVAGMKMKEEED